VSASPSRPVCGAPAPRMGQVGPRTFVNFVSRWHRNSLNVHCRVGGLDWMRFGADD